MWPPSSLSGVPDFFDRNKILSGGDRFHYQVKVTNLKNLSKYFNFETTLTRDTPSEVAW